MTASNRRGFLRALGIRAATDAREVAQVAAPLLGAASPVGIVRAALTLDARPPTAGDEHAADAATPLIDPPAPARCADLNELRALLDAEGLGHRRREIEGLVRRSARMTAHDAAAATAGAWVDLDAAAALAEDAPVDAGASTVMLAQVHLAAPELSGTTLAGMGWLALFAERAAPGALALQATILDAPASPGPTMQPMDLSAHLTLPRVWHEAVQALGLSGDEHGAYVRTRDRLAACQDIDAEQGAGAGKAYHRLGGYPDETTGAMPAACVAAAGPGDWHLLAQISTDAGRRIYAWAVGEQLHRVQGFVR